MKPEPIRDREGASLRARRFGKLERASWQHGGLPALPTARRCSQPSAQREHESGQTRTVREEERLLASVHRSHCVQYAKKMNTILSIVILALGFAASAHGAV